MWQVSVQDILNFMSLSLIDPDKLWFERFPRRQTHIRNPVGDECHAQFLSLGEHKLHRRRIILWKVPDNSRLGAGTIQKIPMLLFADETVEDEDSVLLPIVDEVMKDAADRYGIPRG